MTFNAPPTPAIAAEIVKIASLCANTSTPRAAATVSSWRMAASERPKSERTIIHCTTNMAAKTVSASQ